jgi:hypothetical protein
MKVGMLQEGSTGWELVSINREPSIGLKFYATFLLLACVLGSIKLIRVWWLAPPFRLSRQATNAPYLGFLRGSVSSLKQWIICTLLVAGIFLCTQVYGDCNKLLVQKRIGADLIVFVVRDDAAALVMSLWVVLLLFLIRWHMLKRIEHLRNHQDRSQAQVVPR